jgi:hypothetical protein
MSKVRQKAWPGTIGPESHRALRTWWTVLPWLIQTTVVRARMVTEAGRK